MILHRGVKWRRREWQGDVAFIIDRINTFCFRVIAMPIRPRINALISGIGRNLHDKICILVLACSGNCRGLCVNLLCPSLRSIEPHSVHDQFVLRAIMKFHPDQKLLPRRNRG